MSGQSPNLTCVSCRNSCARCATCGTNAEHIGEAPDFSCSCALNHGGSISQLVPLAVCDCQNRNLGYHLYCYREKVVRELTSFDHMKPKMCSSCGAEFTGFVVSLQSDGDAGSGAITATIEKDPIYAIHLSRIGLPLFLSVASVASIIPLFGALVASLLNRVVSSIVFSIVGVAAAWGVHRIHDLLTSSSNLRPMHATAPMIYVVFFAITIAVVIRGMLATILIAFASRPIEYVAVLSITAALAIALKSEMCTVSAFWVKFRRLNRIRVSRLGTLSRPGSGAGSHSSET